MRMATRTKIGLVLGSSLLVATTLSSFAVYLGNVEQQQTDKIAKAFEVALDANALAQNVQETVTQVDAVMVASDAQSARAKSVKLQNDLQDVDRRRKVLLSRIGDQMSSSEKIQLSLRIDEFIAYQADTARLCLQLSPKAAIIQANDEATVANREKMLADVQSLSQRMLASVETTRTAAALSRDIRQAMLQIVPALAIVIGGLVGAALLRRGEAKLQKRRYDVALNNMPQGICMADEKGALTVVNHRLAKLFGINAELSGCGLRQLAEEIAAATHLAEAERAAFVARFGLHVSTPDSPSFVAALGERVFEFRSGAMEDGGRLIVIDDVTAARRASQKIEHMAMFDGLTGLPNRAQFNDRLAAMIRACGDRRRPLSVLSIDLDCFKEINDTLGHPMGDKLLCEVAGRLAATVRDGDVVARFGGDEFVIILAPTPEALGAEALNLDAICEKLIAAVSAPHDIDGHTIIVSASIGTASFPHDAASVDAIMQYADLALYHSKARGRSCFQHFDVSMEEKATRRRQIETDLRAAIANGELEVFYQPIVDTRTRRVNTFEALLRWRHPVHGLVSPVVFIPIAEETGLIVEIGEWALNRACRDAATWPGTIRVAVNFSPIQFRRCNVATLVARALAASGLAASRLEVEVTETVLIRDAEAALAVFHDLALLGARLSLDDFGTGYSSLSYLNRFPFHKIKIDRAFVIDLDNPKCLAVVNAVRQLAAHLDLSLVAEGVETIDQLELLSKLGVHELQGFLFGKPKPHAEIGDMIEGPIDALLYDAA
jgi:diguanylate cyclase (GGDEF)-like protein